MIRKRFNVWRVEIKWGRMKIELHPLWRFMIIVWVIPPIFGELTWRLLGGKYFGIVLGLFVSSLKTLFDYLVVIYEHRAMGEIKRKDYRSF